MNPTSLLQGGSASVLQGSSPSIQGSSPQLQASNNSGLQVQNSSPNATVSLQPAGGGLGTLTNNNQNAISSTQAAINAGNAETSTITNLLKQIQAEEQADAPGTPISINTNALQAQANASAANTVNPLYTQYLNQYTQEMAANQQAAQAQNTLNIQGEQSSLQNTLQQNQLSENTAANTNALQQGNINVQQQNYQLQTGMAQNSKIQAIDQSIGSGNLGASGLGQQQLYQAENARNVADAAQLGQFQYQRNTSNLSAEDTFAQLAQSSAYSTTQEGEAESQTNFNLNDYLRQAAYNDTQYTQALQSQQQQALTAAEQNDLAQEVQSAITSSGVSGKNLVATNQAYQPYLSTTAMPSISDLGSLQNTFSTSNYGSSV